MPNANTIITMPTPTIIPVMGRVLLRLPLRMILAAAKPIQPPIVATAGKMNIAKKATMMIIR
jgi:predicted HAD superfamily phosphohydrolase YqeG